MSNEVITPTIGRRVWYWPNVQDHYGIDGGEPMTQLAMGQACDAGVVFVHNDRRVNLSVTDHEGKLHRRTDVRLVQGDERANSDEAYATWMPYQKAASQ